LRPDPYQLEIRWKDSHFADQKEHAGWNRLDGKTVMIESDNLADIIYACQEIREGCAGAKGVACSQHSRGVF